MECAVEDIIEFEQEFFSEEDVKILEEVEKNALRETADSGSASNTNHMSPYEKYRGMFHGYITVSNLVSQLWCEQQLEYSFTASKPEPTEAVQQGKDMHLVRELELYDVVDIKTETREDSWAITFLNSYPKLLQLRAGGKVRELPVFGDPYGTGIFIYGIIDEINYTVDGKLQLLELKSRNARRSLPSMAQQRKTELQVMLYKKLFDNLVTGQVPMSSLTTAFNLDWETELSEEPLNYAKDFGLSCHTLRDVMDVFLMVFQYSEIQTITSIAVEYCSQVDFATIAKQDMVFDQEKLDSLMNKFMEYWKGNRCAEGVDVEEAWKCYNCDFAENCSWRERKEQECRERNVLKSYN